MHDALATRWAETWNARDRDAIVRLYADDGVHRMAAGATYVGAAELRPMVDRSLDGYPDLRFRIRNSLLTTSGSDARDPAASTRFVIEYTMTGTQTVAIGDREGTGRSITIDGAMIGELDANARIQRCVDYLDHLSICRQLGLID